MARKPYDQAVWDYARQLRDDPSRRMSWPQISEAIGAKFKGIKLHPDHIRKHLQATSPAAKPNSADGNRTLPISSNDERQDIASMLLAILRKGPTTTVELRARLKVTDAQLTEAINQLRSEGFNVAFERPNIELRKAIPTGDRRRLDISKLYAGEWYKFGFVTDNHLGSRYERLDVLNAAYDRFEREGVQVVYVAGNIIDGYLPKINKFDLLPGLTGYTAQVEYLIANWPKKPGIITHFITGDDHEGWWVRDAGINIGEYIQLKAEKAGRTDLIWLGHMEFDVILDAPKGKTVIRIQHPGGGSAYATSYAPQKIVESLQGGEKPTILLLGHYHKLDCNNIRNIWVVQGGCTQDQTPFMRKKRLAAHIGFSICEFQQAEDGSVPRFRWEGFAFFDRGYYSSNDHYKMW